MTTIAMLCPKPYVGGLGGLLYVRTQGPVVSHPCPVHAPDACNLRSP